MKMNSIANNPKQESHRQIAITILLAILRAISLTGGAFIDGALSTKGPGRLLTPLRQKMQGRCLADDGIAQHAASLSSVIDSMKGERQRYCSASLTFAQSINPSKHCNGGVDIKLWGFSFAPTPRASRVRTRLAVCVHGYMRDWTDPVTHESSPTIEYSVTPQPCEGTASRVRTRLRRRTSDSAKMVILMILMMVILMMMGMD